MDTRNKHRSFIVDMKSFHSFVLPINWENFFYSIVTWNCHDFCSTQRKDHSFICWALKGLFNLSTNNLARLACHPLMFYLVQMKYLQRGHPQRNFYSNWYSKHEVLLWYILLTLILQLPFVNNKSSCLSSDILVLQPQNMIIQPMSKKGSRKLRLEMENIFVYM